MNFDEVRVVLVKNGRVVNESPFGHIGTGLILRLKNHVASLPASLPVYDCREISPDSPGQGVRGLSPGSYTAVGILQIDADRMIVSDEIQVAVLP